MIYRLIARNLTFCEGPLAKCQEELTNISRMISAGLSTDFQLEEFAIVWVRDSEEEVPQKQSSAPQSTF
jgi:hypothetical protein